MSIGLKNAYPEALACLNQSTGRSARRYIPLSKYKYSLPSADVLGHKYKRSKQKSLNIISQLVMNVYVVDATSYHLNCNETVSPFPMPA